MKNLILALSVLAGFSSAFASEKINLDREEITAQSSSLVLLRTENTPSKIRISMPIAATFMECVGGWESRELPLSAMGCRMDPYAGYPHPGYSRRGYRYPGYRHSPMAYGDCSRYIEVCRGFASVNKTVRRDVVLKFKRSATVFGGQEAYSLSGAQNPTNEDDFKFDLTSLSIGGKHKIKERSGVFLIFPVGAQKFIVK